MGIVYKLTCETGLVYYGSTKHNIEHRQSKGWYKCACKDFKNKKIEIVEECDNFKEREDFYIRNNECINKNVVIQTIEDIKKTREKNKEKIEINSKKYRKLIVEEKRFNCELCDLAFQAPAKLTRHIEGFRHKKKYESYLKYGDNWKEYYLKDNKLQYNETRRNKNKK